MKKILGLIIGFVMSCVLTARAGEYGYMLFTQLDGTTRVVAVDGLTFAITADAIQVTNTGGESLSFPRADIASMQFSKDGQAEGLEEVLGGDEPIEVFTPLGVRVGRYESLLQAAGALDKGAYVITNGKNAQTIVLQ